MVAEAGEVLWSGLFNASATVADFDKCKFTPVLVQPSRRLAMSPADTSEAQGIRITIDGTSFWNGQTMERSELIPQTTTDLGSGHLFYHFSLMTNETNAPNPKFEHQIAFFESHFTELKYGLMSGDSASSDSTLRWCVGGTSHWTTQLEAGNWYNFAYDIDFDAQTVGLWASNGSSPLTQVVSGVSASASTNSADWHIGELRLDNGGSDSAAEDWFWSGIFVEKAPITADVAGPK
ncbi:hypothetical protein PENANT_c003G06828 [Penicillium antarcticum]|uniref:Glycoside hydrolase 131 catalytic N-terminal domain-containing protein n=1 Tax=Penicillium antarcticum TaxID=416450 RepID=A0A1V6QIK4_9EURO|nr:hypothetical protein PENANT_c003G06828 [Penicillium antarcticum]